MKLLDLIHTIGSMTRNVTNVVRYPFQIASQTLQNAARNRLEDLEVPLSRPEANRLTHSATPTRGSVQTGFTPAAAVVAKTPTLVGKSLLGRRSRYQVEETLPSSGSFQLYRASRSLNNLSVLVKEYDLTYLSFPELKAAQKKLERLDSLSFRSGGVQDFRLVVPADTWIDMEAKRGYVITAYTSENRLKLREYLIQEKRTKKKKTGLPAPEVRQILGQVLQTLWFMHNHPVRFTDGIVQRGVAHGNLSLDSLLRISDAAMNGENQSQFYIYVNDLGIWKEPFQPPPPGPPASTLLNQLMKRDLISLGMVGFYLLVAETADGYPERFSDPRAHPHWNLVTDEPLKAIIRQLLGLDRTVSFSNADEVRQALNQLANKPEQADVLAQPLPQASQDHTWLVLMQLLILSAAIGISVLAWRWLSQIPRVEPLIPGAPSQLQSVTIPEGTFQYSISKTWRDVLGRGRVVADQTFVNALSQRDIRLSRYQEDNRFPHSDLPHNDPDLLAKLRAGQIDFILGTWDESTQQDLQHQVVAFDGVVMFVAFSDPERSRNIARALQGKMSFQQLQKLYGTDSDWIPPSPLKGMDIQRYAPQDPVAVKLFEQSVLQEKSLIENFRAASNGQISRQDFNAMVASILQNFEDNNQVGIGFARLSKVLGQCSVYPLAIGTAGQEVQPIMADGVAITPAFDLCDRKGSYAPNSKLFASQRYPMVYPLSVIYNAQGQQSAQAFIKALKTDEGQCLLAEAGLVPLQPVRQTGGCVNNAQ